MKKVKWLYYELPIPIGKLSELLLNNQYSEDIGHGFILTTSNNKTVSGRYIEKDITKTIVQDPFGNETENTITTYYICKFSLNKSSNLICIYEPPRSLRKFISKMHNLVGLGFVLSDLTIDPLSWILDIEKRLGKISITHISSYGIRVEKNGLAKVSVSGKKDIRDEFSSFTETVKYKTDTVKFHFEYNNHHVSGSLSKTGLSQVNTPSQAELIDKFQESLKCQIETAKPDGSHITSGSR